MDTSWYIVDDDGNVGLMDYNDNGPVPWGVEQTCCDELIYGHCEDWKENKFLKFNLTDEQILDLLSNPHKPSEEDSWYEVAVRIDKEKTARFKELCSNEDINEKDVLCISENLGLYDFDADYYCTDKTKEGKTLVKGSLKKMIDEGMILEVFNVQNLYMNDDWKDDKIVHTKFFDNSPYYIFHQPYWNGALPEKMHEPHHPVTIEQVPERFRSRIHKIPGNFKEMNTFQIAEFHPCNVWGPDDDTYVVDGCSYQKLPLPDGNTFYAKTGMFEFSFLPYCPEKSRYACHERCTSQCYSFNDCVLTDQPTVLILFDPRENFGYELEVETDVVNQKSYAIPYLRRFPYPSNKSFCTTSDIKELLTTDNLRKVLDKSKGHLNLIIANIKPRVILATEKALEVISNCYDVRNNTVTIDGQQYPFFSYASLETYRTEIEELANQSYRGKKSPQVISLEKMDKLIKEGRAKKYNDLL